MRLEKSQPLSYIAPTTVLVLSAAELDAIAGESVSLSDYTARINAIAVSLGYDPERDDSHFFCCGVRSLPVWLDGVTQSDPVRLGVGVFSGRAKPRSESTKYYARIPGGYIRVESHGMIA